MLVEIDLDRGILLTQRSGRKPKKKEILPKKSNNTSSIIKWNNIKDLHNKMKLRLKKLEPTTNVPIFIYMNKSKFLLDEYEKIVSQKSFEFSKVERNKVSPEEEEIVKKFVNLAKQFAEIEIKTVPTNFMSCENCFKPLSETFNGYICDECGNMSHKFDNVLDIPENFIPRAEPQDNRISGFKEFMLKFQGKCNTEIPTAVKTFIEKSSIKYNMNYSKLSKDNLYLILKGTKFSKYLSLINKVHFEITGISPPDISAFENNIMERIKILVEVYDRVEKKRTSFLNKTFLLWIFLKNEGYVANKKDFIGYKGRNSELESIEIMRDAIQLIKVKYPEMKWKIYPF